MMMMMMMMIIIIIIIIIMPRLLSFLCPGAERTLMHRGAMA
jgi:hypothetical protein